jgi:hypothetical protein
MINEHHTDDISKAQNDAAADNGIQFTFGELSHVAADYIELSLEKDENTDCKSKAILDFIEYAKEFKKFIGTDSD